MAKKKAEKPEIRTVARNRKAHQKFFILETHEAGIALRGHEVKALRQGKAVLDEALVRVDKGEALLFNAYIPPYSHLTHETYEPTRSRKLLLHRREIDRLGSQVQTQGAALVPLEIYFKDGLAKVAVALCKGKKAHDRRDELKKRDAEMEIRRKVGR